MGVIRQIIKNLLLLVILFSFLLSTSGFVITRHICSHHSTEIVLGELTDDCCEIEKETVKTSSCCTPEKTSCITKTENCCQFEQTYVRLSESFIVSEKTDFSKETQQYSACVSNHDAIKTEELNQPAEKTTNIEQEKIPKPRKYLLYHQVKVEPPLI